MLKPFRTLPFDLDVRRREQGQGDFEGQPRLELPNTLPRMDLKRGARSASSRTRSAFIVAPAVSIGAQVHGIEALLGFGTPDGF